MFVSFRQFSFLFLILGLVLPACLGEEAEEPVFNLTADEPLVVDIQSRETIARGNARMTYGQWTLTADEIRFNANTNEAIASGNIVATHPGLRFLGEKAHYWHTEQRVEIEDFRFGRPPYHISGKRAHGTADRMVMEDLEMLYGEPGKFTPRASARSVTLIDQERFEAEGARVLLGAFPIFAFTGFARPLDEPQLVWEARAGYQGHLGVHLGAGVYTPVWDGIQPGGNVDIFTKRGVLFGPGVRYDKEVDGSTTKGKSDFNYIHDSGDTGVDSLGRPIDKDRFFWTWDHRHNFNDEWTVNGQLNWWSDSAVLRDFREDEFDRNQEPDNYLEASLNGSNYILSGFVRGRPNDFFVIPERLPEVRFDLMPTPIAQTGVMLDLRAGAAALTEKPLTPGGEELRSDRADVYAGVSRTFKLAKGVHFTPVAGGRFTHYARTSDGSGDYTRWLGEVGFDTSLRAFRTTDLENPVWGINGTRHIIEPYVSYRYIPSADKGQEFIPAIDRPAFLTQLQPLGLANRRDIDQLSPTNTVRIGLKNLVETRREDYGSRSLFSLDLATDLSFDTEPGEHDFSDIHAEMRVTPADWLDFWLFMRFDPYAIDVAEVNTRITIHDGRLWTLGLDTDFLREDIDQVQVFGRYALSEASTVFGGVRYDGRANRFNEIEVGMDRRIHQLWEVGLGLRFREGTQRESDFGVRLNVHFLAF